jgi:predicted amidohydrolase YtcJ
MTAMASAGSTDAGGADLVVTGDITTVDAVRRWAGAVAVRGDRIVAVGTEREVRERVGGTPPVLSGACIVPGFQDAHIHAAFAGRILRNVNLDDLSSKDAYVERVGAFARDHPELPWIVGGGWYNAVFAAEGWPRREDLDAAVPDRPVFLMNTDTHAAWVNTEALRRGGLTAATADPWDGYAVRDPDGSPSGCLQEGAAYTFWADVVPRESVEGWAASIRVAQRELHALGITGWQDAWVEPDLLRGYRALDDAGELTARVVAALWWDRHRGPEQIDGLVEQRSWGTGGNLHASTVKIMLDGCPESGTASLLDPYEGDVGRDHGRGIQFVEAAALREAVTRLDALGFPVHLHALGDRAVRSALDAVETARATNGAKDLRHHIAHLQLPDPTDVPRLRQLGVVANIQPFWAQPDPMTETMTKPLIGARAARLYPIGDLRRSGAVLCFGSDWPVSTPNPFEEMEVAVTRRAVGDPDGDVLDPAQRIDLPGALAAFTRGSAYVNHDDDAGSIEVGKRADLVVLDRNPFDGPLHAIGETTVVATLGSGRVVYERP